jgi:hypothetical protein
MPSSHTVEQNAKPLLDKVFTESDIRLLKASITPELLKLIRKVIMPRRDGGEAIGNVAELFYQVGGTPQAWRALDNDQLADKVRDYLLITETLEGGLKQIEYLASLELPKTAEEKKSVADKNSTL